MNKKYTHLVTAGLSAFALGVGFVAINEDFVKPVSTVQAATVEYAHHRIPIQYTGYREKGKTDQLLRDNNHYIYTKEEIAVPLDGSTFKVKLPEIQGFYHTDETIDLKFDRNVPGYIKQAAPAKYYWAGMAGDTSPIAYKLNGKTYTSEFLFATKGIDINEFLMPVIPGYTTSPETISKSDFINIEDSYKDLYRVLPVTFTPVKWDELKDLEIKPDSNTAVSMNSVGKINFKKGYSVLLRNEKGEVPSVKKYLKHGTTWKINASKVIDGVTFYRLGNDEQWIEAKYITLTDSTQTVSKIAKINYVKGYSILLRNQNGDIPAKKQYLKHGTSWKVNAKKIINGKTFYRLGNNNQWAEGKFLKF